MSPTTLSLLEFALLGLVHDHQPCCGYDLRKIFTETPMGSFSDSPGSIYPALARLERAKLIRGRVESSSAVRRRKVFRLSPSGRIELSRRLERPITQSDLARDAGTCLAVCLHGKRARSRGLRPIPAVARQGTGRLHSDLAAPPRGGADDEFALGESGAGERRHGLRVLPCLDAPRNPSIQTNSILILISLHSDHRAPLKNRRMIVTGNSIVRFVSVVAFCSQLVTSGICLGQTVSTEMPHVTPAEAGLSPANLEKVKSIARAQVDKRRIAGAVILVARHGKIALLESVGNLDLKASRPMRLDAIFRIYSMTKPITSVAALILVEAGKIKLDDPVSHYLPDLKDLRVYAGKGGTVPAKKPVTVRDLLRHTSGFTYGLLNGSAVDRLYIKHNLGAGDLADLVRALGTLPLQDQPGTRFNYSLSTDVVGRLVEVVSGVPLDRFFRDRIFRPLDMRDTGFVVPDENLDRFATAYVRDARDLLHPSDVPATSRFRKHPRYLSGGGGLVSTARDYARFCQMLLNGGELDGTRILRPDTVAEMTSNQLPSEAMPLSLGGFPLRGFGFGLGVMMRLADKTKPAASDGEYSWSGSSSTYFWVAPKPGLIVVILQQVEPMDLTLQLQLKPAIYAAIAD